MTSATLAPYVLGLEGEKAYIESNASIHWRSPVAHKSELVGTLDPDDPKTWQKALAESIGHLKAC